MWALTGALQIFIDDDDGDDDDTQVKKTSRACVQTYPCFCLTELLSVVTNAPGILRVLAVRRVVDTAQLTSDCGEEEIGVVPDQQQQDILVSIGAKDDGGGGDNWSYKTCRAAVKSSPPTNQHIAFYRPDALPVAQLTVSKHWRENITFHGLAHPEVTWGFSVLVLTIKGFWLPWVSVTKPLLSTLTQCQV